MNLHAVEFESWLAQELHFFVGALWFDFGF